MPEVDPRHIPSILTSKSVMSITKKKIADKKVKKKGKKKS